MIVIEKNLERDVGARRRWRELEAIYRRFNRAEFVDPDPLGPVLQYADPRDQEVVGLITSSLAFGNVKTILASAAVVLRALPVAPRDLGRVAPGVLRARLRGFRHRYVGEREMSALLLGAAAAMRAQGSLAATFEVEWRASGGRFEEALGGFSRRLRGAGSPGNYLLPDPASGSACKRWMMYLRWMARRDAVDPGAWRALGCSLRPRHLLVPVDTHMLRIAAALGFTRRNQGSLVTAREITARFAVLAPRDPVKYDFALTRLGIRRAPEMEGLLARWAAQAERNKTP